MPSQWCHGCWFSTILFYESDLDWPTGRKQYVYPQLTWRNEPMYMCIRVLRTMGNRYQFCSLMALIWSYLIVTQLFHAGSEITIVTVVRKYVPGEILESLHVHTYPLYYLSNNCSERLSMLSHKQQWWSPLKSSFQTEFLNVGNLLTYLRIFDVIKTTLL